MIYSNLGEPGKAVGTELLLYWTLKCGEINSGYLRVRGEGGGR